MTRMDLLNLMKKKGYKVQPYRLDYLVSVGQIPKPELDGSRNRIYTQKHLKTLIKIESLRKRMHALRNKKR